MHLTHKQQKVYAAVRSREFTRLDAQDRVPDALAAVARVPGSDVPPALDELEARKLVTSRRDYHGAVVAIRPVPWWERYQSFLVLCSAIGGAISALCGAVIAVNAAGPILGRWWHYFF